MTDKDTIIDIVESIRTKLGYVVDENYDGNPATVPALPESMEDELQEIAHHLTHLFAQARSAAP
jgi:hypothetical protein